MQAIDYLKKANKIQIITTSILFSFSLLSTIIILTVAPKEIFSSDLFRITFSFIITTSLLILGIVIKNKLKNNILSNIKVLIIFNNIFLFIGIFVPLLLFNPEIPAPKIIAIVLFVFSIISFANYVKGLKQLKKEIENS